ncbi:Kynurenine formamidase [Candidatus Koribacter versatilis Ellin345]|uniref:Kynurenine formamidase n=1 Tax=Koribacter versatilis (strain Ellin345) TaxID=204669 RepID=Q1IND9_KORVE|nr:cyclase family protein [Candidatus Koribacter versatilis]ABF41611.1 Kynurenine formamidase [Candidatus Koribacter versatilis Ellin345]
MIKWKTFTVFWCLALAILLVAKHRSVVATPLTVTTILDLTHTMTESSPTWDDSEKYSAKTTARHDSHGYYARELTLPEHFGTHIDAPAHYAASLWTVDQIPAERLVRPLAIIDITQKAKANPDYQLTVADIAAWEDTHGHIPQAAIVVIRTGWGERWNDAKAFRNADAHGVMHFPGFSLEAAQFLVDARYVVGIGTDTMSVDPGDSRENPVHQYTMARSVYHLENVANLAITPESGATLVVAPAKFQHGSGAPTRLLAMLK